jgi:hypothetical protein
MPIEIRFAPVTCGFSGSGGVGVFVDQAAQDGSSVDLRGAGVGHGGAGDVMSLSGMCCAMPWCGLAVL